jgi:hypothetical protein
MPMMSTLGQRGNLGLVRPAGIGESYLNRQGRRDGPVGGAAGGRSGEDGWFMFGFGVLNWHARARLAVDATGWRWAMWRKCPTFGRSRDCRCNPPLLTGEGIRGTLSGLRRTRCAWSSQGLTTTALMAGWRCMATGPVSSTTPVRCLACVLRALLWFGGSCPQTAARMVRSRSPLSGARPAYAACPSVTTRRTPTPGRTENRTELCSEQEEGLYAR